MKLQILVILLHVVATIHCELQSIERYCSYFTTTTAAGDSCNLMLWNPTSAGKASLFDRKDDIHAKALQEITFLTENCDSNVKLVLFFLKLQNFFKKST